MAEIPQAVLPSSPHDAVGAPNLAQGVEAPPGPPPTHLPWPYLVKTHEAMPLTSSRRMQLYRTWGLSRGSETTWTSPRLVRTAR